MKPKHTQPGVCQFTPPQPADQHKHLSEHQEKEKWHESGDNCHKIHIGPEQTADVAFNDGVLRGHSCPNDLCGTPRSEVCHGCDINSPLDRGLRSATRSEEHTSELQSRGHLVCRLLLEKQKR